MAAHGPIYGTLDLELGISIPRTKSVREWISGGGELNVYWKL